ncbi:MAG: hypothetical protein WA364_17700, partial [Candidatus Nitrosopolaris sp.]
MCRFKFLIITSLLILTLIFSTSKVWGTNESSYQSGYMSGSLQSPDISRNDANYFPQLHDYTCRLANASVIGNGAILPAVTTQTACENGFYDGWKVWCIHNAVNCVGNMTLGYLPDLLLKTHEQYQKGYTISN